MVFAPSVRLGFTLTLKKTFVSCVLMGVKNATQPRLVRPVKMVSFLEIRNALSVIWRQAILVVMSVEILSLAHLIVKNARSMESVEFVKMPIS